MKIPPIPAPVYSDPADALRAWPNIDGAIGVGPFRCPLTPEQRDAIDRFILSARAA